MKKKGKIKELSVKRWTEFRFIRHRLAAIHNDTENYYGNWLTVRLRYHEAEMNIHKVILENMFADTDSKQEQISILRTLIDVEFLLSYGKSEDNRRYTQMGLHLDSNDAIFNFRNGMIT